MGVHNSTETLDKFKDALKILSTKLHVECDKVNGTISKIENEILNAGQKLRKQIQECEKAVKHAQVVYNTCVLVKGERGCRSEEEQLIRAIKQLRTVQERQKAFKKLCQQFALVVENWKKTYFNHELLGNQEKIIGTISKKQELLRQYIQGNKPLC
ncbi:hypothetical protein CN326_18405 [Bacillus sp. AFS018417]|uniref:hypothetical protein n=1 Tax=Bacillus sp. AFS018417 TaxID=2033491 RepID=UPI000BF49AC6|nr:hypothetical protein [Bacillus sp. AFS018417]PEZ03302.1 hypothetical protein CN326_18405 [Bacillus sp. AFS018417]